MKGKERTEQLKAILEELPDKIVRDPKKLQGFIKRWQNGFTQYSFNNTILIFVQKPGATLVAGYKTWISKHNRHVKKGEKALWILAPMIVKDKENPEQKVLIGFKSIPVFDISQTDGDPVNVGCADMMHGKVDIDAFVKASPVPVEFKDLGLANGMTNGKVNYVTPKTGETADASMSGTIAHEVGHIYLDHIKDGFKETDEICSQEIEAEAFKYVVMTYFGVEDERALYYIGNWSRHGDELKGKGKKILSSAERYIRKVEENM